MIFLNALSGTFGLLIIVSIGCILARLQWFSPESQVTLVKLINNIGVPPLLFSTVIKYTKHDELINILISALLPLSSMIICFIIAYIIGKFFKVNKNHFGVFLSCITNSNAIFIGIPITITLFGEQALPYLMIYFIANTIFFWTISNYAISRDNINQQNLSFSKTLLNNIKHIFSPALLGSITGIFVVFFNIPLPKFIINTASILGGMCTPLALIFIGISLHSIGLKNLKINKDMSIILIGRIIIHPLIVLLLLYFFKIPELMGKVFVIMSSLPTMAQVAISAAYYKADSQFGALAVTASTLITTITIPIYMTFLSNNFYKFF